MSQDIFQRYGVVTVGEMSSTSEEHCRQYSAPSGKELSMVFNFHHLKVDYPHGEKWQLGAFDFLQLKAIFRDWQQGFIVRAGMLFSGVITTSQNCQPFWLRQAVPC